jgi:hypothetical protein
MTHHCFEIVCYRVRDVKAADAARQAAQARLQTFAGFVSWTAFSGAEDPLGRVDLVEWLSLDEAKAAAKAVETDPAFTDFMASVASVTSMSHYVAASTQA